MGKTPSLLSARDIGDLNRANVLRALVDHGPLSRSDLARLTGVARGSIGAIVRNLLDADVLEEGAPLANGAVGKPARPLWFAHGAGSVVALELSASSVWAAVVDARGQLSVNRTSRLDDPSDADHVVKVATRIARRVAAQAGEALGVGVALPGTTNPFSGEVIGSGQIPGAVGFQLQTELATATGLPVHIENDSRCQALAEQWFGDGRAVANFAAVRTGTGIGAGLVLDGTLYRSPGGHAPEVGHHVVDLNGDVCVCGQRGCWETIGSLGWVRRTAAERGLAGHETLRCADLVALADDGDRTAQGLLADYADHLGLGLANIHQNFGSNLVILHGDAVGGGEAFRAQVEAAACERSLQPVEVRLTRLGDRATLLGAVALVLTELLHRTLPAPA